MRTKTVDVHFKATPEEKAQLEARALELGISMSELCRQGGLSNKIQIRPSILDMQWAKLAPLHANLSQANRLMHR